LVGRTTTDTLTNKTLNNTSVTGSLTAGGGTGTNGQVLSSTGTGVQCVTSSGGGGSSSYSNQYLLTGNTTNATETEIFINGANNTRIPVTLGTALFFNIDIIGRRTDVLGDSGTYHLKGAVSNFTGNTANIGNLYEIVVTRTDAAFLVDARANSANSALSVYVKGANSKIVSWRAVVTTIEV
jgi:hypothetical protein